MDLEILKIASDTKNHRVLKNCSHFAKFKNPLCGDKMNVSLIVKEDKITDFAYECKSCVYCQASASILAKIIKSIPVKNLKKEISSIYDSFDKQNYILPKKYNLFKPLVNKKNKNRLECIMLPFNAILKALKI